MSCDPRAKLFWGILYPRDDESEGSSADLYDVASEDKKRRMAESFSRPQDDGNYRGPTWDRWRKQVAEWERTTTHVAAGIYGYSDALHDYICIAQSETSVEWDDTADITSLDVGSDWRQTLLDFCVRHGLTWSEPGWKLVSLYF